MAHNYPTFRSPTKLFRHAWKLMAAMTVAVMCQATPALATTCANAIVINPASLPITNQAVVCGTKDDLNDENVPGLLCIGGGSPTFKNGKEALYKFTPNTSGAYQLSYTGQAWSSAMVYIGCPTLNNCLHGFGDYSTTASFSVNLNAGTAYYIWFDAWPDSEIQGPCPGTFSLGPPPSSNDDPCGATALTVNPDMICTTQTPGTLANATQTITVGTFPCAGNPNDDVWFKFMATGPTHYIFLNNVAGNTTDLVLGVYSGSCGSLTNIRCIHALNFSVTDLTPGNVYWVRVFSYPNSAGANTTFNVCVTTPAPPPVCEEMFYDDGGPSGNYFDNTNVTTTICPSTPGGIVSLVFNSFDLDFSDEFAVFDGNSTDAPFMNAYYGNTLPPTLTATNPTGCLTVAFYSDHDENYAGWAAQVTCSTTTLPVEFLSLEATAHTPMIDITWATATEQNSSHYIVERSQDNETFNSIGTVQAAGYSQFRRDYIFVDNAPFKGVNYYRLQQVDLDGNSEQTRTVTATLYAAGGKPILYPNPATDILNVEFLSPEEGSALLVVEDALGRIITQSTKAVLRGEQKAEVSLAGLTTGWYDLRIALPDGSLLQGGAFLKQ